MLQLKHKIILSIVAVVAILSAGMAYFAATSFVEDKQSYLSDLSMQVASYIALIADHDLQAVRAQVDLMDDLIHEVKDENLKRRLLQRSIARSTEIRALNIYDRQGLEMRIGGESQNDPLAGRNVSDFQTAEAKLWREGDAVLLAIPKSERIYVANLRSERFATSMNLVGGLGVFLVGADGRIILENSHPSNAAFAAVHGELMGAVQDRLRQEVSGKVLRLADGERAYGAVAALADFPQFAAIAQVKFAEIQAMLWYVVRKSIFFILALFIVSVGAGVVSSGRITKPIEELTAAAEQIARGDWMIRIKSSADREIGGLIKAFTNMGKELARREEALKSAQEKLMRSERLAALGQFGAGIAHEVKNPLNSVFGYAQLLQKKLQSSSDENVGKYIGFIMDETRRASRIISDLLTFARQKPPVKSSIRAIEILNYACDAVTPAARQANVEVRRDDGLPETPVELDRDQMVQVLTNLMANAIQALETKEGEKRVTVGARPEDGWVIFNIEDNGPGIAPENLARLFEPFFSTKGVGKGTGLGLALSHGIVQQHGGRIDVRSLPGVGTTFSIYIPLNGAAA